MRYAILLFFFITASLAQNLPEFTEKEKAWIKANPVIKVGSGDDWAPFNYVDKYGNFKGITKDYLDLIEKKSGLKVKLTVDKWAVVLQAFKNGDLDLLPAALYKKEREEFGNFIEPHIHLRDFIYTRSDNDSINNFEDLNGKTLARIRGYAVLDPYLPHLKNVKIIEVDSALELISAVLNNKADAFLEGQANINYLLKTNMIGGLKAIAQTVSAPTTAHFLVKKDEPILYEILKKSMQSITPKEHEAIMNRWINLHTLQQQGSEITIKHRKVTFHDVLSIEEIIFFISIMAMLGFIGYKQYAKSGILNIKLKTFNIAIIVFEMLVITYLIYEVLILDRTESALGLVHKKRFEMVEAADQLRHSSDYLTHFARTYAVTGNEEFKQRYYQTLKIRNGEIPRPKDYQRIYWDLNVMTREQLHPDGEKQSLHSLFKSLPFRAEELAQLQLSEKRSNELVEMEVKAFAAMQSGDAERAIALLHSQEYYDSKHKVMLPIDNMLNILHVRTDAEMALLENKIENHFRYLITTGLLFILGNLLIYQLLRRKINKPIDYLTKTIIQFQANMPGIQKHTYFNDEIGFMIEQFFNMHETINERTQQLYNSKASIIKNQQMISISSKYANILYWSINIKTKEFFIDPNFIELLGYNAQEVIDYESEYLGLKKIKKGIAFWTDEVLHHEDKKSTIQSINEVLSGKSELLSIEYRMVRSDKTCFWTKSIGHVNEYDVDGKPFYISGVNIDINEVKEHEAEIAEKELFFRTLLDSQKQIIVTTDGKRLKSVNKSFYNFFAVETIDEFMEVYDADCICDTFDSDAPDWHLRPVMNDESWIEYIIKRPPNSLNKATIIRNGNKYVFAVTAAALPGKENLYAAVFTDVTELVKTKQQVEALHKHTKESIEYASLIQGALIPTHGTLRKHFDDYFVLWHPKDLVGGDIFLLETLRDSDEMLIMVIDCTGHGVAGAFVTMLVKAIERQLVGTINRTDEIVSPAKLLGVFNRSIKHLLQQEHTDSISNAGFDGGIIYYDKKSNLLRFAGANTPLFIMREGELQTIKGDRHSVGYKSSDTDFVFTDHEITIDTQMAFYLSTDGYLDQNGGEKSFPFGKKRFTKLIKEYHEESMADQQELFLDALYEYQNGEERNDDITFVAFKTHPYDSQDESSNSMAGEEI